MARKNQKMRTEQARAVKKLSRRIQQNEKLLREIKQYSDGQKQDMPQIMDPVIQYEKEADQNLQEGPASAFVPAGQEFTPSGGEWEIFLSEEEVDSLVSQETPRSASLLASKIRELRNEKSILESFVVENVSSRTFDGMATGTDIPSTEKIVDLLGKVQDTILGQKPKPELTDSVRAFSKDFSREEAVQCLLDVRKHIQKEELEASKMNRPLSLNLAALAPFQKMLEVDEFLNAGLRSRDRDVRTWASYMKDELFKEANRRSMAERMEMLRELKPEEIRKLVANRSKASTEWLNDSEKQFGQLLGRPDNLFGVYLLASLLPIPGLLVLTGALLPLGLSLTNTVISAIANERMKIVQNDKEGLAKLMLADSASSAVLRAMSETSEKEGLSLSDVLNGYGTALADKNSIYHKIKETVEYGELNDKLVSDIKSLMEPIHRHNQKDSLDFYAFGVEKKPDGSFGATSADPEKKEFAEKTLSRLNESIYSSSLNDFLVKSKEGVTRAGAFASIRPAEAVMFISALRAGMYDSDRQKVADSLMNRCLPSLYEINEKNRESVINGIMEQYGDCTRKYGRYKERTVEELKAFPMEYVIAGAAMGRKEFHEALYDRFRTGDTEQLTTELMKLSDRIVHPHVKNIEEIASVNSSAVTGNELKNKEVQQSDPNINPLNMYEQSSSTSPLSPQNETAAQKDIRVPSTETEAVRETKEKVTTITDKTEKINVFER
jgi:hypothetical protein